MAKMQIAVFISGSGTNLQSIIDHCRDSQIDAEVSVVVSNTTDAYGLVRARNQSIPAVTVLHRQYKSRQDHEEAILRKLEPFAFELICLAGYMRLLSPSFINHFYNTAKGLPGIMNIHPSLLPSFPGTRGYEDAYEAGVKCSGITIHFINEGTDTGQIILQESFERRAEDTLEDFKKWGLAIEHRLYPEAIQLYAHNKLKLEGRFVRILP